MRYFVAGLLLVGLFAIYACSKEPPPRPANRSLGEDQQIPAQPTESSDDEIIWRDSEGRIIH